MIRRRIIRSGVNFKKVKYHTQCVYYTIRIILDGIISYEYHNIYISYMTYERVY